MSRQVYVIFRLNLLGDGVLPAEAIVHITDFVNAHTLQSIINEASSMVQSEIVNFPGISIPLLNISSFKIGQGGTIYITEIGKCYWTELLLLESQFKIIYQHMTA